MDNKTGLQAWTLPVSTMPKSAARSGLECEAMRAKTTFR